MPSTPRFALVLLVGLAGCGDKSSPAANADSAQVRKAARCNAFATRRVEQVAGQVLAMLDAAEKAAAGQQPRGPAVTRQQLQGMINELEGKCLEWPDDVIDCIGDDGSASESCEDRIQRAMGDAAPKRPDTGPPIAWEAKARFVIETWAALPGGTVLGVLANEEGLVAVDQSGERWHRPGKFAPVLAPLSDGKWLTATEADAIAFDPATGDEAWKVAIPPVPKSGAPDYGLYAEWGLRIFYAAGNGDTTVIGDSAGRVFAVDPKQCAKGNKRCLRKELDAFGELGGPRRGRLVVDDAGRRYAAGYSVLSVASPRGKWLAEMHAQRDITGFRKRGDLLAVAVDEEVVGLDIDKCASKKPFGPSGELGSHRTQADRNPEDGPPPLGCRLWRQQVEYLEEDTIAVLDSGLVVVHAHIETVAVQNGSERWRVKTGGSGAMATDGKRLFLANQGVLDGDFPALMELSVADGKELWRTSMPKDNAASGIEYRDGLLVAVSGTAVYAMRVPEPPG